MPITHRKCPPREDNQIKTFETTEKIIMALLWLLPGILVGVIVRLFSYPTTFDSMSDILWQFVPWMTGGGILLASFGFFFPRLSAFILEIILGIEFGSSS